MKNKTKKLSITKKNSEIGVESGISSRSLEIDKGEIKNDDDVL